MVHKYQNAVQVYLWAPLLSSAGSVVLETGKGGLLGSDFPLVGKITKYDTDGVTVLKREIVNITNRSGDIATIARAYETCPLGTASSALQQVAQDFDTNDILEIVVSKKCLDDFNTDIADLQTFRDTTVPATYATKTELANSQLVYGASSAGSDAYAITVANVSAYQNGQRFSFLADVGNTWPATFKVNALSALTIKKNNDQDLATWDIEVGQIVEVVINNTDGVAEMVSQVATVVDLSSATPPALYDSMFIGWETGSAGLAVFAEPVTPFASATSEQFIWDISDNTRISIPAFGSWVSASTLKLALAKVVSPSVNLNFRIETDNSGAPSGTLVHANATGSIAPWSLTTSLADTTITLWGSFSITKGTKVWIVIFVGTYASETINGTNYYKIWYALNNTTTRPGKIFNGTVWSSIASNVTDASWAWFGISTSGGWEERWARILAKENLILKTVTKFTSTSATSVKLKSDAGTLLATGAFSGDSATFNYPLVKGVYYRVEVVQTGTYYYDSPYSASRTNIDYVQGSYDGSNNTRFANIVSIETEANPLFAYVSSGLFEPSVLSLTDADYTYKIDWLWVLSEAMTVWGTPKVVLSGIDSNQSLSWVSNRADLYLSNTPWNISSTPWTNQKTIGIKHSDTKILVEKKLSLKTSTSGVSSGTAQTDMFVNAYATSAGTNQTLIGTSNGNTLQSCSSGNIGGTTQWSICFPVKKWASWSVTWTMWSITVWTTPLN